MLASRETFEGEKAEDWRVSCVSPVCLEVGHNLSVQWCGLACVRALCHLSPAVCVVPDLCAMDTAWFAPGPSPGTEGHVDRPGGPRVLAAAWLLSLLCFPRSARGSAVWERQGVAGGRGKAARRLGAPFWCGWLYLVSVFDLACAEGLRFS